LDPVTNKKGLNSDFRELLGTTYSKRPILLIGDVGVGKSTFIDHLQIVDAPQVFANALSFKIDLGSKAILTLDVKRSILKIIEKQLKDDYKIDIYEDDFVRHAYYIDLENFKRNVKVKRLYEINLEKALEKEIEFLTELVEDFSTHLQRSLEYISRSREKQIVVFIDNCDQRNDQDQETAFLAAQEFASEWQVLVFISIRPETFHRTKKHTGALSGYHTKAFTISPPRIDEVVQKRLSFAQRIATGEIPLSAIPVRTSFSVLDKLIQVFKESLKENERLYEFIENISNGNVRRAIELIKKFFGSGHVDFEKIFQIKSSSGSYTIPVHEVLRSIVYGDNVHFHPNNPDIVNILDVRTAHKNEHFLVPIILKVLADFSDNSRNQGFVELPILYTQLQGYGFTPIQVDTALNFMYSKALFETSEKGNFLDTANSTLMIRTTSSGIYHIEFLIGTFAYLDAIIVDLPIFDSITRSKCLNVMDIGRRLDRVRLVVEYLDSCWAESKFGDILFQWPQKSTEILSEVDKIAKRSQKF